MASSNTTPRTPADWQDAQATLCTCDRCHKLAWCLWRPDPLVSQFHPQEDAERELWCRPCTVEERAEVYTCLGVGVR